MAKPRTFWPKERSGKFSLLIGVLAFGIGFLLPVITGIFGETYPITDSWVMPTIGVAAMIIAAVSNIFTYTFMRQRSVANLIMLSITVFWACFTATFLIGEGLAGI